MSHEHTRAHTGTHAHILSIQCSHLLVSKHTRNTQTLCRVVQENRKICCILSRLQTKKKLTQTFYYKKKKQCQTTKHRPSGKACPLVQVLQTQQPRQLQKTCKQKQKQAHTHTHTHTHAHSKCSDSEQSKFAFCGASEKKVWSFKSPTIVGKKWKIGPTIDCLCALSALRSLLSALCSLLSVCVCVYVCVCVCVCVCVYVCVCMCVYSKPWALRKFFEIWILHLWLVLSLTFSLCVCVCVCVCVRTVCMSNMKKKPDEPISQTELEPEEQTRFVMSASPRPTQNEQPVLSLSLCSLSTLSLSLLSALCFFTFWSLSVFCPSVCALYVCVS